MKRLRYTPEQIVRKLREAERLPGEGQTIAEAAKQVEISGSAQQGREFGARLGGPVAGRVGLHHPLGDGVAVRIDESCRSMFCLLPCRE